MKIPSSFTHPHFATNLCDTNRDILKDEKMSFQALIRSKITIKVITMTCVLYFKSSKVIYLDLRKVMSELMNRSFESGLYSKSDGSSS